MKIKVSIIVPVYNSRKYLYRCIGSILEQTYKNFELILIEDGSNDKSGEICDKFVKLDNRIKVIHKKNEGVSAARNDGINVAIGEYITFIDSDDWISSNYLENLLFNMENDACDLSIGIIENRGVKSTCISREDKVIDILKCSESEKISVLKTQEISSPCVKLYKTTIIKNNNIQFKKDMKRLEDYLFVVEYLQFTKKISISSYAKYYYNRMTIDSLTKKKYTMFAEWSIIFLEKYKELLQLYNISIELLNDEVSLMAYRWINMCLGMYINNDMILLGDAISMLYPYLQLGNKWVNQGGELQIINRYILEKDINSISVIYNKYLKRHYFGNLYSKYKLKIIKNYLEKNRDLLKAYKKKYHKI